MDLLSRETVFERLKLITNTAEEIQYYMDGDYLNEAEMMAIYVRLLRIFDESDDILRRHSQVFIQNNSEGR